MKEVFTLFLLLFCKLSFSQALFQTGKNEKDYACYLKINVDSSINFVIQDNHHLNYQESIGYIKHISDSTYLVSAKAIFEQSIFENDRNEFSRFDIQVDSIYPQFKDIEKLNVKYYDGKCTILKTQKGKFTSFYFDKKRFNKQHPYIKIYTNRENPITKEIVYVKLFIRASIGFQVYIMKSLKL